MIGGILASTVVAIFFAPLLFWLLESLSARFGERKADVGVHGGGATSAAHAKPVGD